MNAIALTVNGKPLRVDVAPRTHLADFLRDELYLTGTHLGCEQGICGACTLLVDGAPARSCIIFAAVCEGAEIRTIEGFADDPAMAALRSAFKIEHALQCGYCTPGMLVTARDIVLRLPDADDDQIRLELAGNLCRCTGYNGIVRAIRLVLDARLSFEPAVRPDSAEIEVSPANSADAAPVARQESTRGRPAGNALVQALRFGVTPEALWRALQDPALIAGCVPGAELRSVEGQHITGQMAVSLGPIQGHFVGVADVVYDQPGRTGTVSGEGQDKLSNTRISAKATFAVLPNGATGSILSLTVTYNLRGALAQVARAPVVQAFADEIAGMAGRTLQARLTGAQVQQAVRPMSAMRLLGRVVWSRLKGLLSRNRNV
jgi:carbon-monoxide dehydrogenase small subunit